MAEISAAIPKKGLNNVLWDRKNLGSNFCQINEKWLKRCRISCNFVTGWSGF
jgi:hypothetical protein